MPGKSTKTNRKINKALVYYRTRTRENRKITSTWYSMGLRKWQENNRQLEIRNHIHRQYRDWETINYITKYMLKVDEKHPKFRGKVLCSAGIGAGYLKREDAKKHVYIQGKTNESYRMRNGGKLNLRLS